jgi:hypothetical protein
MPTEPGRGARPGRRRAKVPGTAVRRYAVRPRGVKLAHRRYDGDHANLGGAVSLTALSTVSTGCGQLCGRTNGVADSPLHFHRQL